MHTTTFRLLLLASILSGCTTQEMAQTLDPARLTYHRDVEPLVQQSCQGCHREGGIAPFALTTYEDVFAHRSEIAADVENRVMPPWMPSSTCAPLRDSRALAQAEIDTIVGWAGGLAPEGDAADAPAPAPAAPGLPSVDVKVDPGVVYTPPGEVMDHYQCLILDPKLTKSEDLIGYNVVPGASELVHHILLYPAARAAAEALDAAEPGPGWSCFGGPGVDAAPVAGWVPGLPATLYPAGTGIPLEAGQVLIMQLHYNMLGGPPRPDLTSVELAYAHQPVAKRARVIGLGNSSFSIPPAATGYDVTATIKTPADVTVWGVLPHAHNLAQQMKVEASDGSCLIDIPHWDFHWQQLYFFDAPDGMRMKKGMEAKLTCTYDNPGAAPVTFGERTSDEMCLNYFYVTL